MMHLRLLGQKLALIRKKGGKVFFSCAFHYLLYLCGGPQGSACLDEKRTGSVSLSFVFNEKAHRQNAFAA
jgi:hypothetical protein